MKNFLLFILILVSKPLFACGFYPYGEELRFSFFNPNVFRYYGYSEFNYSSDSFKPKALYEEEEAELSPNEVLWLRYCNHKVPASAVWEVLYGDKTIGNDNKMLQYLHRQQDWEAINYLKFAKSCEFFNTWLDDPWERRSGAILPERTKQIDKAIRLSKQVTNNEIKRRYTFLAIRLAFYNKDFATIRKLYDTVFKNQGNQDILNYWSLYFRTLAETDKALANFYAARVFENAPDKRFMIAQQYNRTVPIDQVLKYAATNQEKASVYFLAGILKHDRALENLEKTYRYNPRSEAMNFLLLREVNKIEDWIFTPYYSLFSPSVTSFWEENSVKIVLKRVENDRDYARKVLRFVNTVNINKVEDAVFWKTTKAHLLFITKDYSESLVLIGQLAQENKSNAALLKQLALLKALNLTANQANGKAVIPEEVQTIILKNKDNQKFIFALGRELEYKGNTTDAALLYTRLGNGDRYSSEVVWKTQKNKGDTYFDFYDNYFDYVNVMYTPKQLEQLIGDILANRNKKDVFSAWKYNGLQKEIPRLYDLLGTKYIRRNELPAALAGFKKVTQDFWDKKYTAWEKTASYWDYSNVFDKNPFYELNYTPKFIPVKDSMRLTKTSITRQLIRYLNKADNPAEQNRDYYYFLTANCYYNMTQYGNAWMMRRYSWSSSGNHSVLEDESEYYECNLAKKYYRLALENAKTRKFKALCLRMIGRCEKNRLAYRYPDRYGSDIKDYDSYLLGKNRYYSDLKNNYSDDYTSLTSDCSFFEDYFKARR